MQKRYKLARIFTRGVGLGLKQSFEALKSTGAEMVFENKCFISEDEKGINLLSKDFKHKAFVPKDKVVSMEILAGDLAKMSVKSPQNEVFLKAV